MSQATLSEAAALSRDVETFGRDLTRRLGDGTLPPSEAEEALRSLIGLSGRLATLHADLATTIAAQERQMAELAAQIAQLQRDLYGSRSERRKEGEDGRDGEDSRRQGGKPDRKKDRGDAVSDTGLRFGADAPVIDITVTPPEIEVSG